MRSIALSVLFLKIASQNREPKRIVGKCVHNNVYYCDSIAVNSSISICYDAVWLLFKYKELRKLRNKMINIVYMFVECFTEEVKKSFIVVASLKLYKKQLVYFQNKTTLEVIQASLKVCKHYFNLHW